MSWKGTKGKWEINPKASRNIRCNNLTVANCSQGQNGENEDEEKNNAVLIADAGNTIQRYPLMPSELLRQYGVLLESTSNSMEAIESILKNYELKEVHAKAIQTIIDTNKKFKKLKTWK
jgi:hypothetical protein